MNRVLLTSEDYIKTNSNISDNVWGDYLLPAIREAQEMGLQTILGSCLYSKVIYLVDNNLIGEAENAAYKVLLDEYIQDYLMYRTITDLVPIIGVKLANLGTVISNDEHVQSLTESERSNLKHYYEMRADFYARRMQEFLLNNRADFEELKDCDCDRIKANLNSAASTGIWLGGMRGRRVK